MPDRTAEEPGHQSLAMGMTPSLKYAVVERERRFLVRSLPATVSRVSLIVDRYLEGSRLRLREVREDDGRVVRKLGQKVRLGEGPEEVACTSMYLDDAEWDVLSRLPARVLRRRRHHLELDAASLSIDELEDGTLLAEIDDGDRPPMSVPSWLDVIRDVSADEAWTGAALAYSRGTRASSAWSPLATDIPVQVSLRYDGLPARCLEDPPRST